MSEKKKLSKKMIVIISSVVVLLFLGAGYALLSGDSEEVFDVKLKTDTKSAYDNYRGEEIDVDPDVKKQINEKMIERRNTSNENKDTNLEYIPLDTKYIDIEDGVNINDFFKDEHIPCITSEYDENGFNCKTGFDRDGFNKDGRDENGFDRDGCGIDGFNILGERCGDIEIDENPCVDGVDSNGQLCGDYAVKFDENGCTEDGLDADGNVCPAPVEPEPEPEPEPEIKPICLTEEECIERKRYGVSLDAEEKARYENMLSQKTSALKSLIAGTQPNTFKSKHKTEFKTYVEPEPEKEEVVENPQDRPQQVVNNEIQIPTGSMINAKLVSDINSDYGGTVRVEVVGGPLNGAMMYGSFEVPFIGSVHYPRDKVAIKLDKMVYKRKTYSISAIGLDNETLNDFVGGDVNNHYLLRWGGLIGSNFLKGMGEAVSNNRYGIAGDGSDNIISNPLTGTKDQMKMAAGMVGSELASIAREQFNRPPTVKINRNDHKALFPVVFLDEVVDPELPMLFSRNEQQDINMRMMNNPDLFK